MKKNAAVIGYGGMGGWHTEHMMKSDVVSLAGIYDIKPERCELAESRGIRAYKSREELLSDESVELITVAIPNDDHEEVVIACLNAGKNVICEKPVTLSMDSLERMIAAAEKNGKIFAVHQNRRWDVDYLAMKAIKESGEIGEVINIESRIHGSRGIPSDWRGEKEHGGGMLYDWGVHLIDQVMMILGFDGIASVRCYFEHTTNFEVDDGCQLEITYKNGQRALVEVGTLNFIPMPRFYMRAKSGTALIRDWRENAQVVKCKYWHENDVLPVQTAAGLTKTMAPRDSVTVDEYEAPRPVSDVHDYYRNFVKAIDGEATQFVTHDQMRAVLRVILAGFESAETGKTVYFD
ncbi:MAG: Gfo/Idh/MocA family oxidoreductase [Clostridia bacterium]|nr:Gfo/Idh/MocA family oxidoreductase [Clostridia bacterium]